MNVHTTFDLRTRTIGSGWGAAKSALIRLTACKVAHTVYRDWASFPLQSNISSTLSDLQHSVNIISVGLHVRLIISMIMIHDSLTVDIIIIIIIVIKHVQMREYTRKFS